MREIDFGYSNASLCVECRAGVMRPRQIPYFTWLGEELVTVPSFPAWICDICGRREYDEKAIQWLNMILDPNAGKPTKNKHRTPPLSSRRSGFQRPIQDS